MSKRNCRCSCLPFFDISGMSINREEKHWSCCFATENALPRIEKCMCFTFANYLDYTSSHLLLQCSKVFFVFVVGSWFGSCCLFDFFGFGFLFVFVFWLLLAKCTR